MVDVKVGITYAERGSPDARRTVDRNDGTDSDVFPFASGSESYRANGHYSMNVICGPKDLVEIPPEPEDTE